MEQLDVQVLNKKLAEWAGWEYRECNPNHPQLKNSEYGMGWFHPDSNIGSFKPLDFTHSLDAIFKWLVPKLDEYDRMEILMGWAYNVVSLEDEPALALCLAIERLIDET